jgi:K+-transporting ATPase ATPase C chain
MRNIAKALWTSLIATLILSAVVSFVYPTAVWGLAQLIAPFKANGSLAEKDGKIIGSYLLGQNFQSPQYFHPRPSAAGQGYDAANSGGSNFGPISEKFLLGRQDKPETKDVDESFKGLRQRVEEYRSINKLGADVKIPVDAVTASASGLDPHISPRNAELQAPRVAAARKMDLGIVRKLIEEATEEPDLGILGERRVNVLRLNLALGG